MARPRALFLTNGGHIRLPGNQALFDDLLARQAGLEVIQCSDNSLLAPEQLRGFDLILDYGGDTRQEMADEHLEALLAAVEAGTPFIGLHAATLPFRSRLAYIQQRGDGWPHGVEADGQCSATQLRYFAMLGSAFITHTPIKPFTVHIADGTHPITRGVSDFEIEDERYQVAADWTRLHVLAEAEGHPLLYVLRWGRGKVHYSGLGHTQQALAHPGYQRLLAQAIAWALDHA